MQIDACTAWFMAAQAHRLQPLLLLRVCFNCIRHNATVVVVWQAHLGAKVDGKLTMPNMPDLLTGPADDPDGVTLALPDNSSVPSPEVPGLDLSRGVAAAVEGRRTVMPA